MTVPFSREGTCHAGDEESVPFQTIRRRPSGCGVLSQASRTPVRTVFSTWSRKQKRCVADEIPGLRKDP